MGGTERPRRQDGFRTNSVATPVATGTNGVAQPSFDGAEILPELAAPKDDRNRCVRHPFGLHVGPQGGMIGVPAAPEPRP